MTASDILIVIGREFGSGGRALGRELSHRLSVPFYDKELLTEAARQFGIALPAIERQDERRPSALRNMMESAFGMMPVYSSPGFTPEHLYQLQSHVIEKLAQQGGAIFVGRTADYILRNNPRLLSIFVHADEDTRINRIIRRGDCKTKDEARELARQKDRLRQGYYNFFTGRQWGVASNYHLSLDLSKINPSSAAELVMQVAYAFSQKQ